MEVTVRIPQDINKFCRTCLNLADDNFFYHRLIQDKRVTNISTFFESVTSLKIAVGDGLPESICDDCYESLVESYAYKNRSYDSEKKLKTILEKCSTNTSKDLNSIKNIQDTTEDDMINRILIPNQEDFQCECEQCHLKFSSYYQLSRHMFQHNATKTILERFLENSVEEETNVEEFNESDILELISIRKLNNKQEVVVNESLEEEISVEQPTVSKLDTKRPIVIKILCKICCKRFSSMKELNKHSCHTPSNSKVVDSFNKSCSLCGKVFSDPCALSLHFLKHIESIETNFIFCEVCGQLFDCHTKLDQHYSKKHISKLVWSCTECQATFITEIELLKHNMLHSSLTYVPLDNSFPCVLCNKICFSETDLLKHLPTHLVFKNSCKKCEAVFCSQESYYVHLKSHPGAKYICNICRKPLNSRSYLKLHIDTVHFPTTTFKCETCDKEFKTLDRLKRHHHVHSKDRTYICSACGYTAYHSGDLQVHMRTHTNEKPYKCTFLNCKSSFTTSSHLHTHSRNHLKIRLFKCTYCPADFNTGHTLKKHLMIHTGERPHACNVCHKSFRRLHHVKVHMKQHDLA